MEVVIKKRPRMTLEEFADAHGLMMEVYEIAPVYGFPKGSDKSWFASFQNTQIWDNGCLMGAFGNGATPEDAMREYGNRISECRLVIDPYRHNRREIEVPIIIPTAQAKPEE